MSAGFHFHSTLFTSKAARNWGNQLLLTRLASRKWRGNVVDEEHQVNMAGRMSESEGKKLHFRFQFSSLELLFLCRLARSLSLTKIWHLVSLFAFFIAPYCSIWIRYTNTHPTRPASMAKRFFFPLDDARHKSDFGGEREIIFRKKVSLDSKRERENETRDKCLRKALRMKHSAMCMRFAYVVDGNPIMWFKEPQSGSNRTKLAHILRMKRTIWIVKWGKCGKCGLVTFCWEFFRWRMLKFQAFSLLRIRNLWELFEKMFEQFLNKVTQAMK